MSRSLGFWPADLPRPEGQPPLLDLLLRAAGPKRSVEVAPLEGAERWLIRVRGPGGLIVVAERGIWEDAARRAVAALFALGLGVGRIA